MTVAGTVLLQSLHESLMASMPAWKVHCHILSFFHVQCVERSRPVLQYKRLLCLLPGNAWKVHQQIVSTRNDGDVGLHGYTIWLTGILIKWESCPEPEEVRESLGEGTRLEPQVRLAKFTVSHLTNAQMKAHM